MTKYYIGQEPEIWNEFASSLNPVRSEVERRWERTIFRQLLPRLRSSELRVWLFIKSRTLDWQKFAEAISMDHFLEGMRDERGELKCTPDGEPITSGCGIKKEDTVRTAMNSLRRKGAIEVFPGKRGSATPANVYMPLSRTRLSKWLVEAGSGVLPTCAPFVSGEHVRRLDAVWRITAVEEGVLRLRKVLSCDFVTHEEIVASPEEVERLTPEEWKSFSRRKLRAAA
ncbi:hypothetical protein [Sphingomonas agri]|uniref:hypothetical protein n=1 Tax=Sphingomonas agri TaxID=1813878 RepID=UPI00311FAD40